MHMYSARHGLLFSSVFLLGETQSLVREEREVLFF